jgi:hypothetical protein
MSSMRPFGIELIVTAIFNKPVIILTFSKSSHFLQLCIGGAFIAPSGFITPTVLAFRQGGFLLERTQMDTTNEIVGLLYVALATAAGGRELLDESNEILRAAVECGHISRPDTRKEILAIIATTSRAANNA